MQSFSFYTPTKIEFGIGSELKVAENVKQFGCSRVIIIHGSDRVLKNGLMDKVTNNLKENGIEFTIIGGVVANPLLSFCYDAIEKAKEFKADFVLGVGGGSVIDTSKAVAHGLANPETDIWEFWLRTKDLVKSTPVGVILTMSAAGSEMSDSAVLTNDKTMQKRGLNTVFNKAKFALMNPELTYSVPKDQIACGVVDIMMHTLDRYFTSNTVNQMTDLIAESVLKNIMTNGVVAYQNPTDYTAVSEMMWTSTLSHNSITGLGQLPDFAPHALAHELSGKFNTYHGAALSTIWGSWAMYTYKTDIKRFEKYGKNVLGLDEGDSEKTALKAIEKTVEFFKTLDMPTCFSEASIPLQTEAELKELGFKCVFEGKRVVGNFMKLEEKDCTAIYTLANR